MNRNKKQFLREEIQCEEVADDLLLLLPDSHTSSSSSSSSWRVPLRKTMKKEIDSKLLPTTYNCKMQGYVCEMLMSSRSPSITTED